MDLGDKKEEIWGRQSHDSNKIEPLEKFSSKSQGRGVISSRYQRKLQGITSCWLWVVK